jgi:hypothetical protein
MVNQEIFVGVSDKEANDALKQIYNQPGKPIRGENNGGYGAGAGK